MPPPIPSSPASTPTPAPAATYAKNQIICASTKLGGNQPIHYSIDGGATWNQSSLPTAAVADVRQGDPAIDFSADGTAWALTLGIDATKANIIVRCFKSTDQGKTWTFDSTVCGTQTNTDRESLWIDHNPSSPFHDNMYAVWQTGSLWVARRAGPGGAWQAPLQVSAGETTGSAVGADVKANTAGDVFAFWPDTGSKAMYMAKSTNGAVAFGTPVKIASTNGSFMVTIPAQSGRRVAMFISGGAYKVSGVDMVYAVWADKITTAADPGTDTTSTNKMRIFFARSLDGGTTWQAAQKINDQASLNDQFFPRLVVDEASGDMVVVYYDTAGDAGRLKTDLWMQSSFDNGASWTGASQVTSSQTDETSAGSTGTFQYGDYIGFTGYSGQYFACWTDRRSGASEEIWGSPITLVARAATFILHKDHFGQDETDSLRLSTTGPVFQGAISLQVDGFTPRELGITGPASKSLAPGISFSPSTGVGASCSSLTSTDPTFSPDTLQRFWFNYDVNFGATDIAFTSFTALQESVGITATFNSLPAANGILTFMKQPDPFIQQGAQTWWLSSDIRLIQVAEGDSAFGVQMTGNDPIGFLANLTAALETGQGTAGGQVFDQNTEEEQEVITTAPVKLRGLQLVPVYNFAIARVHYRGNTQPANNVRVFFRLFAANTTDTNFQPTTSYRRSPSAYPVAASNFGNHVTAIAGIDSGNYVTFPCYGVPRQNASQAGAANTLPALQYDSFNDRNLPATGTSQKDFYYGSYLDINQSTPALPQIPPAGNNDGPWPTAMAGNPILSPAQVFTRNDHNCLVAEIAFDPDAINTGTQAWNSDKFAQRNISWSTVANPGTEASRMALQNFEVKPTALNLMAGETPDEIMIDWKNVPAGEAAEIFLPDVSAADVIQKANQLYKTHHLSVVDTNTIGCKTGGMSFIPLPPGTGNGLNFTGLMSVTLPFGIKKGSLYKIIVKQITNDGTAIFGRAAGNDLNIEASFKKQDSSKLILWRKVHGAFQINIPVSTKELMLPKEEIRLSIFRWIGLSINLHNRWYRVFQRYLSLLSDKVAALGGNPSAIKPSANGYDGLPGGGVHGHHHGHQGHHEGQQLCYTGKITGLCFDNFGDFEGFELSTVKGMHRFSSREKYVEELVARAWRERLRITVCSERHEPHRPISFLVHEPSSGF